MTSLQKVPTSLLDDLRNATEFYKCVQAEAQAGGNCTDNGSWADAREWLRTAALNLGEALIAGGAESEVPHA